MKLFLCALALLACVSTRAATVVFDFVYQSTFGPLIGQLDGELQADGNTVIVTSVHNFAVFDGAALSFSTPYVDSVFGTTLPGPAMVTLDGTGMDFTACASSQCLEGFAFLTPGFGLSGYGASPIATASFFGLETYTPSNWSMSYATIVPSPSTLALLAAALTGWVLLLRRAA